MCVRIAWCVKLLLKDSVTYRVKKGQTLKDVAAAFSLPELLIARHNDLKEEVAAGQIVKLPKVRGNLYTVREGDTKTLLSGSDENFEKTNGSGVIYPGLKVLV